MNKLARISIGIVVTPALIAGLAWANRVELMLSAIGFVTDQRYPTRPGVPVDWESAPNPAPMVNGRPAGQCWST